MSQRQHIQDREKLRSSVRFYSKDIVKIEGMSIADNIFAEVTEVHGQE